MLLPNLEAENEPFIDSFEMHEPTSDAPGNSPKNTEVSLQETHTHDDYTMQESEEESESCQRPPVQISWRRILIKVLVFITVFLILTGLLDYFADEEVTAASEYLMGHMGLTGLYIAVFILDGVPQPFTYVPLIFMAVKGSVSKPVVFVICTLGSYSAAMSGYFVGLKIRRWRWLSGFMDNLTEKYPVVPQLMERKGAIGVGLAGLLPVPFALATWTAGSFRVNFPRFALAGLMRMPKIALFVLLSRRAVPSLVANFPEVNSTEDVLVRLL